MKLYQLHENSHGEILGVHIGFIFKQLTRISIIFS